MNILPRTKKITTQKTQKKVLSDRSIKKAAKQSIEDQKKLSRQASKLRAQTVSTQLSGLRGRQSYLE